MCLASRYFYPAYAGPAVRFHRYASGLQARNVQMRVFAGTSDNIDGHGKAAGKTVHSSQIRLKNGTLLPLEHVDEIPVQRVQLPPDRGWLRYPLYTRALAHYCQYSAEPPDLIQFISLSLEAVPWLFQLRRLHLPLVDTQTMVGELSTKLWKRRLQLLYWRLPFQFMDCIVVSSGVMRDALYELGVTTRIEVISNGVDLKRFHPLSALNARGNLRKQLGLDPAAELILFVGSISPRKGLDVLAEAWSLLGRKRPRAYLVLVGPGQHEIRPWEPEADFQAKVKATLTRSGAADRVIFTGPVENVEDYLHAADLFVFPSRREGMPNVVPEAMACGLPCILTPFLGLPTEFGNPGEHYMLVERTPEALASAMVTLLDKPEQRQQLGNQGRKWAEEHMDVEMSLDQYAALYRELVNRSKRGELRAL